MWNSVLCAILQFDPLAKIFRKNWSGSNTFVRMIWGMKQKIANSRNQSWREHWTIEFENNRTCCCPSGSSKCWNSVASSSRNCQTVNGKLVGTTRVNFKDGIILIRSWASDACIPYPKAGWEIRAARSNGDPNNLAEAKSIFTIYYWYL